MSWSNLFRQKSAQNARPGKRKREAAPKGAPHGKWSDCVHKVGAKGGPYNPYAVCGASVHRKEAQPTSGKTYPVWLWASSLDNLKTRRSKPSPEKPTDTIQDSQAKTADEQVIDLIVKNPNISGPTLLNLLKSQGLQIVDTKPATGDSKDQTQADSASTNAPSLRSGVNSASTNPLKKSKKVVQKQANVSMREFNFKTNAFLETDSTYNPNGTVFKVVLLQEGMGNFADRFYYTRKALESALPVFEGKKIYANHPSMIEEQARPERDVRDILGHFEGLHIEETDDGRSQLVANLTILQDQPFEWARALMRHSVDYAKKYPDKEFVGLSINASGDATEMPLSSLMETEQIPPSAVVKLQKAQSEGIENARVVNVIESAVSCDLVTEAGAGGKILQLLEEEKTMKTKKNKEAAAKGKDAEKKLNLREDGAGDGGSDDGGDAGHADAAQDKELIKSMLKKHLGLDDASPEEMEMYQSAHEAFSEMGMEDEKAHEAAANAMKLHKHMAAKGAKDQPAPDKDGDGDGDGGQQEGETQMTQQESNRVEKLEKELARLSGVVAKYQERDAQSEVAAHVEKVCADSKLPMSATKQFKKLVEGKKSIKQVDELFQVFKEGHSVAGGEASDVIFGIEKQAGGVEGGKAVSFADCVND